MSKRSSSAVTNDERTSFPRKREKRELPLPEGKENLSFDTVTDDVVGSADLTSSSFKQHVARKASCKVSSGEQGERNDGSRVIMADDLGIGTPSPSMKRQRGGHYGLQSTSLDPYDRVPHGVIDIDFTAPTEASLYDAVYARHIDCSMRKKEAECIIDNVNNVFYEGLASASSGSAPSSSKGRTTEKPVQTVVTERMRNTMVDWFAQVQSNPELRLSDATFHLAVQLLDLMVSRLTVSKKQFYHMTVACLMISSKIHDIFAPESWTLLMHFDSSQSDDERLVEKRGVLRMEQVVLCQLGFNIITPTREYFAQRFIRAGIMTGREKALAMYLVDLSVYEFAMGGHAPSKVAAAAVHLARQICRPLRENVWTRTLQFYTSYTERDIAPVVVGLARAHRLRSMYSVDEKYSTEAHHMVSANIMSLSDKHLRFSYMSL